MERIKANQGAIAAAAGVAAAVGLVYYVANRSSVSNVRRNGSYPPQSLPEGAYDAVIVGAGPSGSSCAYYLVKAGAKVALLDKETFPRDKYCGDAVRASPTCFPDLFVDILMREDSTWHGIVV